MAAKRRAAPMTADDPRHGTYAGAVAHWQAGERPSEVCRPCCDAGSRHRKRVAFRAHRGGRGRVPRIGYARRIHALQALGWSVVAIAREAGISPGQLNHVVDARTDTRFRHTGESILVPTAARIQKAYDALSMKIPTGPRVDMVRRHAARRGWAPPLDWEMYDIDDPNVEPSHGRDPDDVGPAPVTRNAKINRRELLEECIAEGVGISEAVRRDGASRAAIQKWCGNHDLHDLYRELALREAGLSGGIETADHPARQRRPRTEEEAA